MLIVQNFIHGDFEDHEGDMLDSVNPATGQVKCCLTVPILDTFPASRFGLAFPTAAKRPSIELSTPPFKPFQTGPSSDMRSRKERKKYPLMHLVPQESFISTESRRLAGETSDGIRRGRGQGPGQASGSRQGHGHSQVKHICSTSNLALHLEPC